MATNPPRLTSDYAPKGLKAGFIRLSDAKGSATGDYAEVIVGDGAPSGAYGRASGASMVYVRKDATTATPVVYSTPDGGTTWAPVGDSAAALTDPGDGTAIPVTRSASIAITTAAAETNTLAIPTFAGQRLALICDVYAVGDRVITASAPINQTGNTIMTFGAMGDMIVLQGMQVAGGLVWRVVANDGVALS